VRVFWIRFYCSLINAKARVDDKKASFIGFSRVSSMQLYISGENDFCCSTSKCLLRHQGTLVLLSRRRLPTPIIDRSIHPYARRRRRRRRRRKGSLCKPRLFKRVMSARQQGFESGFFDAAKCSWEYKYYFKSCRRSTHDSHEAQYVGKDFTKLQL
jgi:hypothetical protein